REDFGIAKPIAMMAWPVLKMLPQSRNSHFGNIVRKSVKFAEGARLNLQDRYWRWASIATLQHATELLNNKADTNIFNERKQAVLRLLNNDFNSLLFTDVRLVLQNDMLVKTDVMSMANSLEVRTPLLDYRLVEFLFTLPYTYKIPPDSQKKILRDSVAHLLPPEILTRKKHGFEVPLLKWFQKELRSSIETNWLNDNYIKQQGLFNVEEIKKLKQQLYSANPQDAVARVWGLIAFQHWYKKYIDD
ncbi:MAG TPA: asparagine synthase-related protein, partial [Bacteroidia bacterium]|nr:asparagine synthase-related protein [Bacteroidia bacterium]